ncbi:MAG TPA: Holliday junction branch migration protein RuvA [Paludibacteraceae bacterium]|nr:Holliday junction branch migration protein RuvA [Paludibacteraceae bacterium]HPT43104.1 Holliday junction branch migration protein RuvA [Paludibacteraceae bacterium]
MIDYIKGAITELTPANVVLETGGVGYFINIPLTTYTALNGKTEAQLFVFEAIREDAYVLFGFLTRDERQLFLLLISVSGIGANTARVIMSSYTASEIQQMIAGGDVVSLNAIKGIGTKTAQRIIVDLKDKILKVGTGTEMKGSLFPASSPVRDETVAALVMLGFAASASQKVVDKIIRDDPSLSVEKVLKLALKML